MSEPSCSQQATHPDAMSSAQIKDRVREQYTALLEAFSNLLRSARLPDEGGDAGARQVSLFRRLSYETS